METRRELSGHFKTYEELILEHHGRLIDRAGDGIFAEFRQTSDAVECARQFQDRVTEVNSDRPIDQRMRFRVGVAYGDILQEAELISGPKVNIAARLQQLAEPGAIVLDGDAHKTMEGYGDYAFDDMGFRVLKGISNPIRVWRIVEPGDFSRPASDQLALEYETGDSENADRRGIAVLPFDITSGNEENAYLAEGLIHDIADGLARSSWLRVISPRSSVNYTSTNYDDRSAAEELGVRYLLKGRIRWVGEQVRISASLNDATTNEIVWSENFTRRDQNIFDIQDEITPLIVAKIEPEFLRHESQRAASGRPRNVDAWDLLMRSRWHFWRGSKRQMELALICAEKALQLEPENSETLAQLSFCHMTQVWTASCEDPIGKTKEALRFARLAVNSDEHNPNAHFTLGTALSLLKEVQPAIHAERRALELNPNFAGALGELARLLAFDGKAEEARRAALKAIDISPSDPHISLWVRSLAIAAFVEKDYAAASNFAREACAKRPDWFFNYVLLASCEALLENIESAHQAMSEVYRMVSSYPSAAVIAGHPFTEKNAAEAFLVGLRLAGWQED